MANIKIEHLVVKYYHGRKSLITAIDNLDLEIKDGSFNVIIGYSGCGKTTLLRVLAGTQFYEGNVTIDGCDATSISPKERNISLVNQNYSLYPHMTIFENIAFPLTINGCEKEEIITRVNEIAKKLGIEYCLTRKPKHLSGGQQQRVALARALIKRPNLYLFDEPLSNFDPEIRQEARQLIKKLITETQTTAIYVTHDLLEASALADNLILMNEGKVIMTGSPEEILNSENEIIKNLKMGNING